MADCEKLIARKVLNLLHASNLDPDDPMLTEASASASETHSTIAAPDNLRSSTWIAIETLRKAIVDQSATSLRRALHRAAIAAAERWLNASS